MVRISTICAALHLGHGESTWGMAKDRLAEFAVVLTWAAREPGSLVVRHNAECPGRVRRVNGDFIEPDGAPPHRCGADNRGRQHCPLDYAQALIAYECPNCHYTTSVVVPPIDPEHH
jgi:hypothetical protein